MIDTALLIGATIYSSLLSLMAIGLTFTFITMKVPNFAHGDFVAIGGYVAYTLYILSGNKIEPIFAIPLAFALTGLVALGVYVLGLRPLSKRRVGVADMMIAFLAIEIILRSSILIYTDSMRSYTGRYFVNVLVLDKSVSVFGWEVSLVFISSIVTTVVVLSSLAIFLSKTRRGIALRAAIENPALASSLGIDVDRCYALAWFIAGGVTGLTGPLLLYVFPLSPGVGWAYNVRIFASSILGGLNSLSGAVVGGLIIGYSETLGSYMLAKPPIGLPAVYRVVIPFAVMIATILLMPRGINETIRRYLEKRRG